MDESFSPPPSLTSPENLRKLMIRAWDGDAGNGSLRPDLWHVFQIACELEFTRMGVERSPAVAEARLCALVIWKNRGAPYAKARWRALDSALHEVFGPGRGW